MKYFGTDGIRGRATESLTVDIAFRLGKALALLDSKTVVIGTDTRASRDMLFSAIASGCMAMGLDVIDAGIIPTPGLIYYSNVKGITGVMVTASHNPYYDNGIKLINSNGEKMDEETILLVEDYIDGKLRLFGQEWKELPYAHKDAIGCTVDYVAGRNRYMGYLISLGVYSFKGMKVGLDCANGSSWNMAKSIFEALGAKCYEK